MLIGSFCLAGLVHTYAQTETDDAISRMNYDDLVAKRNTFRFSLHLDFNDLEHGEGWLPVDRATKFVLDRNGQQHSLVATCLFNGKVWQLGNRFGTNERYGEFTLLYRLQIDNRQFYEKRRHFDVGQKDKRYLGRQWQSKPPPISETISQAPLRITITCDEGSDHVLFSAEPIPGVFSSKGRKDHAVSQTGHRERLKQTTLTIQLHADWSRCRVGAVHTGGSLYIDFSNDKNPFLLSTWLNKEQLRGLDHRSLDRDDFKLHRPATRKTTTMILPAAYVNKSVKMRVWGVARNKTLSGKLLGAGTKDVWSHKAYLPLRIAAGESVTVQVDLANEEVDVKEKKPKEERE